MQSLGHCLNHPLNFSPPLWHRTEQTPGQCTHPNAACKPHSTMCLGLMNGMKAQAVDLTPPRPGWQDMRSACGP